MKCVKIVNNNTRFLHGVCFFYHNIFEINSTCFFMCYNFVISLSYNTFSGEQKKKMVFTRTFGNQKQRHKVKSFLENLLLVLSSINIFKLNVF